MPTAWNAYCVEHLIAGGAWDALPDRKTAINWVIDNQLSRRNLDPFEVSILRGKKYLLEKKEVGRPKRENEKSVQNAHIKTRDKVAEEMGVNTATIHRDVQLAEAVEDLKDIPIEILKQNPIL